MTRHLRSLAPPSCVLALAAVAIAATGCGSATMHIASLDEVDRVHAAEAGSETARLAHDAFARAEYLRGVALTTHAQRDDIGANLIAQQALAAYQHAVVIARLAHAATELADAQKALDEATATAKDLDAQRAAIDHEASDLETRAEVERTRLLPARSAASTAEREAARWTAARSLVAEATLLCDAAHLLKPDAEGLAAASSDAAALATRLAGPPPRPSPSATALSPLTSPAKTAADSSSPAKAAQTTAPAKATQTPSVKAATPALSPIDEAAQARVRCLDVLTTIRRGADSAGAADALLTELSATGGLDPARDDRGVVVTLRGAFASGGAGPKVTDAAEATLEAMGRVAAAHPTFAVQVVVHDATSPAAKDDTDAKRAQAAIDAVVKGGASAARIHAELPGARLPVADPNDARERPRNERLDVVFVAP